MAARARAARPSTEPDTPCFVSGPAAWLAIRTADPGAALQALGLRTVLSSNWRSGLAEVRDGGVFLSPPVDGWVLAVGSPFGPADAAAVIPPLLEHLSRTFARVAWFLSDDRGERHGWAVAERGEVQRAYAFDGERGHSLWHGDVTEHERALGCFVDDPRDGSDDDLKWWPDAALVRTLAAAWSIDPTSLPRRGLPPSTGWVGRL